jgi:DNA-binding FadR family transcriptional regulator
MKIQQRRVVDQVMEHMKNRIAQGEYGPGDRIPTELELAQELGVGRSSIREAIKIFNHLGIMTSHASRGTFVNERSKISSEALTWALLLGNDEIDEVVELRGAIELWSFIRITRNFRDSAETIQPIILGLENQLSQMEKAFANEDQQAMIDADYEFHRLVIEGSRNSLFMEMYLVLRAFMIDEIQKSQRMYTDRSLIITEHRRLLEAICSGDITEAEAVYTAHIQNIIALMHE